MKRFTRTAWASAPRVQRYRTAAPRLALEPFARLTTPFGCDVSNITSRPVEIFFQGLAPNLAAVYQFDFRIPPGTPNGNFVLYCVPGAPGGSGPSIFANLPVAAAQ